MATTNYVKASLIRQGLNVSAYPHVKCNACAALVINGVATHEIECPNAMHECAGCNVLVPMRVKYCEDCR